MTRFLLPLLLLLFSPLLGRAASSADAVRALAHIVTFGPAGDTLAHAEGFFVDAAGTLVAPYAPFRGATRALITDSRRRQGRVLRIAGADETLDLLRATTDLPRRADEFLPLTAQGYPAGVALTLVSPAPAPRGTLIPTTVLTAEALRSPPHSDTPFPNTSAPPRSADARPQAARCIPRRPHNPFPPLRHAASPSVPLRAQKNGTAQCMCDAECFGRPSLRSVIWVGEPRAVRRRCGALACRRGA